MKKIPLLLILAISLSCGEKKTEETPARQLSGTMEVTDSWARPASAGMMSAAYFVIKNGTSKADSLLSVESDVTEDTQIHESYTSDDGLMGMRPVGLVPIPSGAEVEFRQGGLHVMIIQPRKDLLEGESITLSLQFSESGMYELIVPIRSQN